MKNNNTDTIWMFRLPIIWIVILNMFGFSTATAQDAINQHADSLLNIANKAPNKQLKIEGLLDVSVFWIDYDTVKAHHYLEEAHKLMKEPPTAYQKGLYHLYHANILMDFRPEEAKVEFITADSLLKKDTTAKSYFYRSKLWNNYGMILQRANKNDEFMEIIIKKSIPYARLSGDSVQVGKQLQNVGILFFNFFNYKKAAEFYEKALGATLTLDENKQIRLDIFINAAKNEIHLKDLPKARVFLDSARVYVQQFPHATKIIPSYYTTELVYYKNVGNKKKVLENYNKGMEFSRKYNDKYTIQDLNFGLFDFYNNLGDFKNAKRYLKLSYENRAFHILQNQVVYQWELAKIESKLGNYKAAYYYMDSLKVTMDSIYQKDVSTKILDLEQQYQTKEKENQILRLETKNKQQELAIAKSRWWELALGAGFVLAVFIAYFLWKLSAKNKKLLIQNDLLHKEELRAMRQQERLSQYDSMLQGQEAERSRMAKDLHDGLGGLLAGVKLKLSSIVARAGEAQAGAKNAINDVVRQLDYSVDELRRIAHDMMPESLRFGGLAPALSDLCRYMGTPMVQVVFQNLGIKDNYPDQLRVTVYRVVQELLTNAIKHANATKIILQCSELDNWLFVTVEDNGKGMEQKEEKSKKGLGLVNIQNRISLLNGNIETISQPGEGTTVNIQIPL